ncbi:CRM domain-containing protein [Heracleum sosnowskyi]|uniref:CRM domain-containing protein n=1 Tax=Heracleum sosnowskyi TaxID=360622 RepID=A0AAD8M4R1_9APIA|nr:CRM domain-containing protein [Heracleum sosnowskyi]
MLPLKISIRSFTARFSKLITSSPIKERAIRNEFHSLDEFGPVLSSTGQRRIFVSRGDLFPRLHVRHFSNSLVEMKTDDEVVKFSFGTQPAYGRIRRKEKKTPRQVKMSKRAKLNELRFYRLKAKKKLNSPNPEVRIRYKLDKAKRKEEWLIEKLRKFNVPRVPDEPHDPEILTEEERFYLKRTGEKKKNYVPVGRRGVFGGVVLNMHLHWKNNETVKIPCQKLRPWKNINLSSPLSIQVNSLKNWSMSWKSIISTWLGIRKGRKKLCTTLLQCSTPNACGNQQKQEYFDDN